MMWKYAVSREAVTLLCTYSHLPRNRRKQPLVDVSRQQREADSDPRGRSWRSWLCSLCSASETLRTSRCWRQRSNKLLMGTYGKTHICTAAPFNIESAAYELLLKTTEQNVAEEHGGKICKWNHPHSAWVRENGHSGQSEHLTWQQSRIIAK